MKSKQLKIAGIVTIATYLLIFCLYWFHQRTKFHLDARQAEFYKCELMENKDDSARNKVLISERTAIKIANRIFSEKYGIRYAFLCKPFDIWLFNDYWFVYGPVSKSKFNNGPMIIINNHTGETRFKL